MIRFISGALILTFAFSALAKPSQVMKKEAPGAFADQLSQKMLHEDQFNQMVEGIVQAGFDLAGLKASEDKLELDFSKLQQDLDKQIRKAFTYKYFVETNVRTMKKNFKDDELKQILDFYDTPVGKKWLKATPEIISETMNQVRVDLEARVPKMVESFAKKK